MAMPLFLPRRGASQQPQGGPIQIGGSNPLARGLVSHMPLTGRAYLDVADKSAWTAVASSTPIAFDVAPLGLAMRVKGATPAYITRPIPVALNVNGVLTVRYRVYFHSVSTQHAIMSWGNVPQDGSPRYYVQISSSTLRFFYAGDYHFNVPVQAEREYIVTDTWDGSLHSIYLNGVLVASSGGGWTGNFANLYLGMGYDGATASTDFLLSDFAMWNRALSPQEVVSDAQSPWQMFAAPQRVLTLGSSAGSGATATPTGVSATAAVGTPSASGSASATPSGVIATAAVGTATASAGTSASAAPSGVAATASVGSPVATGGAGVTPAGVKASATIGSPAASGGATVTAIGVPSTAGIGTASASGSAAVAATGIAASAVVGTAQGSGSATAAPAGVSAFGAVGMPTASSAGAGIASPTGVSAIASVGTATASGSANVTATGVAAFAVVAGPGQVTAATSSSGTAAPVGVSATAQVGTASASGTANAAPAGVMATMTVGQVIAAGTIFINGNAQPAGVIAYGLVGNATARDSSVQPRRFPLAGQTQSRPLAGHRQTYPLEGKV